MPYIGIGGVEKNLFIISNFLKKKLKMLAFVLHLQIIKENFSKILN